MSPPATASYLEEIIEHCKQAKFTGLLRMRSHQGEGELWFLSGVRDDARFGVSHGDEALERMGRASEPTFELVPRLPPPTSSSKRGYPLEGSLGDLRPVDLFRFCETNALTCTLELMRGKTSARARYQLGELMGVESDSADAAGIAQMLEWTEGNYRFELPPLELPSGVPVHVPPVAEVLASLGLDSHPAPQDTARNKAEEEAAARKKAEAEAAARKKAEEEAAARKKAEAEAAARKKAEEEAAARRKAEEEAAARKKAEAEAARKQAEEEEAQRRAAEEEAKRKAVSVHRQIAIGSSTSPGPSEPPRPDPTPPSPPAAEPAPAEAAPPSSKASQASAPEIAVSEAAADEPEAPAPEEEKPAKSEDKPAKSEGKRAKSTEKKPKSVRREAPAPVVESEPPPAPKKGAPWLAIFVVLLLAAAAAYYFYTAR